MNRTFLRAHIIALITIAFIAFTGLLIAPAEAASNPPGFGKSLEEIAKLAEKEGRVRIATGLDDEESKKVIQKFNKRYPGIKVDSTQVTGAGNEKIFTELMAGNADYDAVNIPSEF